MNRTDAGLSVVPKEETVQQSAASENDASKREAQQDKARESSQGLLGSLETVKAERDELRDRLARTQAEFENVRKRLTKEQEEFKELALADAMKALLPILDGFDWALQSQYQDVEEFRTGINLVRKQLQDSLTKLGLRSIPANGEPFDPRLHEAVEVVDTDVAQDNHVLKDVRRGYKLKDRLLRPSMVLVAHNSEAGAAGEQSKNM